ncbi:MmgE/PrpD family protein [Chloroflexota bacterium]
MAITDDLASFLVNTDFKDIPRETVDNAKDLTIDFIGQALAGTRTGAGKIIMDYTRQAGGTPQASVIGGNLQVPVASATLANTTLAHSTELESVGLKTGPNTAMAHPVALALAEKYNLSGKDVLESSILGFEIQGALYEACPGVAARGWDHASVFGVFGAAATAAKALKLNTEQIKMALSLAASGASGFMRQVGSMTHYLEFGLVARHGLEAAELVKAGFTAEPDIIEHHKGFAQAFAGEGGYNLDMKLNLGNPYRMTMVSIKKYPCCYRAHRAIDATLELMKEHGFSYDDIASAEVDMNLFDASLMRYSEPNTGGQGRFSMQHTVAMAILGKAGDVEAFSDDFAMSAKAKEARGKVKVTIRTDWPPERLAARTPVTIKLKDGRTFSKDVDAPRQATREDFLSRHRKCSESVLRPEQVERFTNMLYHLEELEDITNLMTLLRG